jgi:hypothetical protein
MQRQALLLGVVVLAARLMTIPRTPWDGDELRFPFAMMVAISIAASVITAIALAVAFKDAMPALLFSLSAAVMVHAPTARLDSAAWMFLALALVCVERPALLGLCSAAAIVCQPQMVFGALALFGAALFLVVTERKGRINATVAFALVLAPFLHVPQNLAPPGALNVVRFVLHPWGAKWIALPVFVCVAVGVWSLKGDRRWQIADRRGGSATVVVSPLPSAICHLRSEVLMWAAFAHLAFGIALVDPADGVRYAVPVMMFVAVLAAEGLRAIRVGWIGAAALCAMSIAYAYPLLRARVLLPSPPVAAARAIPHGAIVLHERDETMPFAKGVRIDDGLRRYVDHPEVPLVIFADGKANDGRVFTRPESDAFGKLTRNAMRTVSLVPVMQRWAPIRGVYGVERNESGESWRWLQGEAELRVPNAAHLELRLPADAPIPFVDVNGVRIARGATVRIPAASLLRASQTFVLPAPDTRRVSVQLVKVTP